MKSLRIGVAVLALACGALGQVKLEMTASGEGRGPQRVLLWGRGCDARMEDLGEKKGQFYMIVRDCGKRTFAVSPADKAVVKMQAMESNPAPDIETAALFMQGHPSIKVEKVVEDKGDSVAGRATTHYRFKTTYKPDLPGTQDSVALIVDEEFWIDPTLDAPGLDGLLGKAPPGERNEPVRAAYAEMKGLPLRHRIAVMVKRGEKMEQRPAFTQEVVSVSTQPLRDEVFEWPKEYQLVDTTAAPQ